MYIGEFQFINIYNIYIYIDNFPGLILRENYIT